MKRIPVLIALMPFLTFGQKSLDKYYSMLNDYREGRRQYSDMPYLAYTAKAIKDEQTARLIAKDYIENYLFKSANCLNLSKGNIDFVRQFTNSSGDKGFQLLFEHGARVDEYIGYSGYSQNFVDYIIAKEEIDPKLWKDNDINKPIANPDWEKITTTIQGKYTREHAYRTVLNAKLRWYRFTKDSLQVARCIIEKAEKLGIDTGGFQKLQLNNDIYDFVFKHIEDKVDLRKAIGYMEIILKNDTENGSVLDTYANLLYKTGRTNEALLLEEKALKLSPSDKSIQKALSKMKQGLPSW